jgi:phosphohistidine phosphatase
MSATTRRLVIMRHAKSSWDTGEDDHRRPLNKRGRRDAGRVALALASLGWAPDYVLSSDSRRTTETWDRMSAALALDVPVRFTRSLYLAGLGDLQVEAGGVPDAVETLLVLGHNPGWELAASRLTGSPIHLTTGNAVLLEFDLWPWAEVLETRGRLMGVIRPKEIRV